MKNTLGNTLRITKTGFLSGKKEAEYLSKSVIFATGTRWRKLPMKGAKEFVCVFDDKLYAESKAGNME